MNGTKKWWESKTVWGVLIGSALSLYTIASTVLRLFGVVLPQLPAGLKDSLVEIVLAIAGVAGSVAAIIGRIKAREVIE